MKNITGYFSIIKSYFALFLLVLFPLFFLPVTPEYYVTNKMYFLAFGSLILLFISIIEIMITREFEWKQMSYANIFFLIVITLGLSVLISSPNKIQAILQPNFGLISIISLSIFAYYLSKNMKRDIVTLLAIPALLLSITAVVFYFQPFKTVNLPITFSFLKNQSFSPIGSQIDLLVFLVFIAIYTVVNLLQKTRKKLLPVFISIFAITGATSIFLIVLIILKKITISLPPFYLSWYAAIEILKQPLTALFGVGVDNFSSMFTKVKDLGYNQSEFWQISSFNISRSGFLHIMTETGIFGLFSFIVLFVMLIKESLKKSKALFICALYLIFVFLFLPVSIISLFLLFVLTVQVLTWGQLDDEKPAYKFNLTKLLPLYVAFIVLGLVGIVGSGYFVARFYSASYYFKKSLDEYAINNGKGMYDMMQKSTVINPYDEQVRVNFSQANLLIANNIAQQGSDRISKENVKPENALTEQQRQTISQAIQAAINEAKAGVALNPQKAGLWDNLATIYRAVISVAQGADTWTVSAYQRAIVLDPQNPVYRLNLGGVYYSLGNYNEAKNLFSQSVGLKPDWANAHYNLSWAYFQSKEYQPAVAEMQNVLVLVNPKTNKVDYEKASKDLEEFKKLLPKEEAVTPQESTEQKKELAVPTPVEKTDPQIKLPKTASPEGKMD